jgi:orotate phosphoribosyltransferase
MTSDLLATVPSRDGHFRVESGYHTNIWLTLDGLFTDAAAIMPAVTELAERLRPHGATAICGPFVGGAFLAQLLAIRLQARFFYTQPVAAEANRGLFTARYALTPDLQRQIAGERVAVVDEVISAGSSVRATAAAVEAAGASIVAVAALAVLGDTALTHFASARIPVETLDARPFTMWTPDRCPLCAARVDLEDPTSAR